MVIILELLASLSGDAAMLLRKVSEDTNETRRGHAEFGTAITKPLKVVAARVHKGELNVIGLASRSARAAPPARRASGASA
jgi:hypothetical protein